MDAAGAALLLMLLVFLFEHPAQLLTECFLHGGKSSKANFTSLPLSSSASQSLRQLRKNGLRALHGYGYNRREFVPKPTTGWSALLG